MKNLLFTMLFSYGISAQEKEYMYCQIVGTSKMLSNKVTVELDFGQATSFFGAAQRLRDENGKPIKFNSMVDAMNWMGKTDGNLCKHMWLLMLNRTCTIGC